MCVRACVCVCVFKIGRVDGGRWMGVMGEVYNIVTILSLLCLRSGRGGNYT